MKLQGIFAPLTTPFESNGDLALDRFRSNVKKYNRTGLAGYVINGSTSESVLLSWNEIYGAWEAVKEAADPQKVLVAGSGAESTRETIEHSKRAAELGYHAVLVRTPSFYKPAISDDMLAEHYLRVADAVPIPVLIYSVPVFTHVKVEAPLVRRLAHHKNIVGMKDSSGDIELLARIIHAAPKDFQVLTGSTSTLHDSLKVGASGGILAVACAFPDLCAELWEAARSNNHKFARTSQERLTAFSATLKAEHGIAGLKYALDQLGYYGGPVRAPLLAISQAVRRSIDGVIAVHAAGAAAHRHASSASS